MTTSKIYTRNAAYQKFTVLKTNRYKRHKYGEFFVEGVRNINEAILMNWEIVSFIFSFEAVLSKWAQNLLETVPTAINYGLPDSLMNELSGKDEPSELLAVVKMGNEHGTKRNTAKHHVSVLFDRPSNKGNLGTILRSCECFGVDELIITGHSVDIYDPDVIAASTGAFFKVPFIQLTDNELINKYIDGIKERYPDLSIIGTSPHEQKYVFDLDLTVPLLVLIGNEASGLNRYLREKSDYMAAIPMDENSSVKSLNVSCAASVLFYEIARQRLL
jgi:TrmH family RNA methyltransferase